MTTRSLQRIILSLSRLNSTVSSIERVRWWKVLLVRLAPTRLIRTVGRLSLDQVTGMRLVLLSAHKARRSWLTMTRRSQPTSHPDTFSAERYASGPIQVNEE